ncbi:MAG: peptide chain release factor N(5)-glutamine methyltransferase [Terriglobales bacterium]
MPSIAELIAAAAAQLAAAGLAEPRRDAETLWLAASGQERAWRFAHPEAAPEAAAAARFQRWVTARAGHLPLQYLTGEQEFFGRAFRVTPAVLIPRPETELVVAAAIEKAGETARDRAGESLTLLDAGAGSGAIAVTLALELQAGEDARPTDPKQEPGHWRVFACDRSAVALAVARDNAARVGGAVGLVQSDWLTAFAERPIFDLIVANPPYVAADEWVGLERQVREYEPYAALVAGPTGREAYQRLMPQARARLRPGGWLILETGYRSAAALQSLLVGWAAVETRRDYQGWDRVLLLRR